jgi:hypothetical protein
MKRRQFITLLWRGRAGFCPPIRNHTFALAPSIDR